LCLALPGLSLGIAMKVESGVDAARPAAVLALLHRLAPDHVPAADPSPWLQVRNSAGRVVGDWRAVEPS